MSDKKGYEPAPLEAADVFFPQELTPLMEELAASIHDAWARQRISEGWSYGPERSDTLKTTPVLIPYDELPESEKEYDRITARQTILLLVQKGYRIVRD